MAITYKPRPPNTYGLPDGRRPLKVLIAGAGIGGLTAALALREAGHTVQVFEAAPQAQETGAALHITPNAAGLAQRLGLDLAALGGVACAGMRNYLPESGQVQFSIDITESSKVFQHPLYLVHRQRLHSALKDKALATDGKGRPVQLHLNAPIASVDALKATVTTADGAVFQGDVVIGADGVHSKTRAAISETKPFNSGKSAFRFLIPIDALAKDPRTAALVEPRGYQCNWVKDDRRLISYPCDDNEYINYVAIHPREASVNEADGIDAWRQGCTKERVLDIYGGFCEPVRATLEKIEQDTLRIWPVWDMEQMTTFVEANLALIGDAAHPLMPYQGQGAGLAMEDAMSLAALLPLGTLKRDVPERLGLYNTLRHERTHRIQGISRNVGKDSAQLAAEGIKLDFPAFQAYMYNHDEYFASTHALQKHLEAKEPVLHRAPLAFGPTPGPYQPLNLPACHQTVQTLQKLNPESYITHSIRFRTSSSFAKHLLPPKFSFFKAGTAVSATLAVTTRYCAAWLAGGSVSDVTLYLHDVVHTAPDGRTAHGMFVPVQFSNSAEHTVAGREEHGFPRLRADISTVAQGATGFVAEISWQGVVFGRLALTQLGPDEPLDETASPPVAPALRGWGPPPPPPEQGFFVHRYVPAGDGGAPPDADYALLYPFQPPAIDQGNLAKPVVQRAEAATVAFEARDWKSLPTLHHVAQRLAEMPVFAIENARVKAGVAPEEVSRPVRLG